LLNSRRILPTPPQAAIFGYCRACQTYNRQQALLDKATNPVIKASIVSLLNPIKSMNLSHFIPMVVTAAIIDRRITQGSRFDGQTVECTHLDGAGYLQKASPIQSAIPSKRVVCSLFPNFYSIPVNCTKFHTQHLKA
jgi:hypothetical protein